MKKFIYSGLSIIFTVLIFTSCDKTYTDLMTADVKTGGILIPTDAVPYKLGGTINFDVVLDILKGPGIEAVEIYKTYTGKTEVLDQTVNVGSENATDDKTITLTYNYAKLIAGLSMPADESVLNIGDAWTLRYVSVMGDGRKVEVSGKTIVGVANFFAGAYVKNMKYFHPTAGGTYPTTAYSAYTENVNLSAINAFECLDWFGVWENTHITIHIASDNTVTLTFEDRDDAVQGDPNNSANVSSYDPNTGIIKLYYFYPGAGGNRIFWVVYTPK